METRGRQKLLPEDLQQLQEVESRLRALRMKPTAYAPKEAERIHADYLLVMGDLVERYEIDEEHKGWTISAYTGRVRYP
jgi:hypothetical protein